MPMPEALAQPQPSSGAGAGAVRPGIEAFMANVPEALRGKRVGLITNHSAIDRQRVPDIDLIAAHKDLKLVALLAAEHATGQYQLDLIKIHAKAKSGAGRTASVGHVAASVASVAGIAQTATRSR